MPTQMQKQRYITSVNLVGNLAQRTGHGPFNRRMALKMRQMRHYMACHENRPTLRLLQRLTSKDLDGTRR